MKEPKERRNRWERKPTGRKVEVTDRDLKWLTALARYQFLNTNYLHAFAGGSLARFNHHLGDLHHERKLTDRPLEARDYPNENYRPIVYELNHKGYQYLQERGIVLPKRYVIDRKGEGGHRNFSHQLGACEVMASIELEIRNHPDLEFIPQHEAIKKAPQATLEARVPFAIPDSEDRGSAKTFLIPDGLFGIRYLKAPSNRNVRFFALEFDNGTMPVERAESRGTSVERKFLSYQNIINRRLYEKHLGIPSFMPLFVTISEERMENMLRVLDKIPGASKNAFIFQSTFPLGDMRKSPRPEPGFLTGAYKRAGQPDYFIHTPTGGLNG
ncbi:replication-relaxation family protein [Dongia sp.]|uniref:replication-relaxation family protein n=1 Tax=Dongia sp. TaxID=1977262 RepID=UPI00375329F9